MKSILVLCVFVVGVFIFSSKASADTNVNGLNVNNVKPLVTSESFEETARRKSKRKAMLKKAKENRIKNKLKKRRNLKKKLKARRKK